MKSRCYTSLIKDVQRRIEDNMARKFIKNLTTKAQLFRIKQIKKIVFNTLKKGENNWEDRIYLKIIWDKPKI